MKWISAQDGKLVHLHEQAAQGAPGPKNLTGLAGLDALIPEEGFRKGAVHELLHQPEHPQPRFIAALLATQAKQAISSQSSPSKETPKSSPMAEHATDAFSCSFALKQEDIAESLKRFDQSSQPASRNAQLLIWFDPDHTLYPPALAAMGIDLTRLYIVRPKDYAEHLWALAECLRCPAVGAVVAGVDRLSRTDARKLQLAAEQGGGIALLLRPLNKNANTYSAATRWLIEPAPGERNVQRWRIQLLHGHGRRDRSLVYLEHHRETHLLRTTDQLADRQDQATPTRTRAG